jgi:hypothetical protein
MYWHGFPMKFDAFLDLPLTDRWFAMLELGNLIERSNEQGANSGSDDD